MEFACCNRTIYEPEDPLVCTLCDSKYHCACVFPNKTASLITEDIRDSWRCPSPSCENKSPRNNKDETPVRIVTRRMKQKGDKNMVSADKITNSKSANVNQQTVTLDDIRNIIKSEIKEAFMGFNTIMEDLKSEISSLQQSLNFMSDKYDSLIKRIENVEAKTKSCDVIKSDFNSLNSKALEIQADLNKKEQWSRRSNIEIIGMPESKNENLMDIVTGLSTLINYQHSIKSDIDFVTRVTPKHNDTKKPRPIVIRFMSRYKKDDFLARLKDKKQLRACDLGYVGNNNRIFFNEHLTSFNKMLLRKTKEIAREKKYVYVWVKNCAIMARKTDTSPVLHIHAENDLKKL